MSDLGKALLNRVHPHAAMARKLLHLEPEAEKGCCGEILPEPVDIEPPFTPMAHWEGSIRPDRPAYGLMTPAPQHSDVTRLQVWVSPEQATDWVRSEMFISQAAGADDALGFEIVGNSQRLELRLVCHADSVPSITAAFRGVFQQSRLTPLAGDDLLVSTAASGWHDVELLDYYPPPPYCNMLTRPETLKLSPLNTLIAALCGISPPGLGLYQVLFRLLHPLHNWSANIQVLKDEYYGMNRLRSFGYGEKYAQQTPSNELRNLAMDVEVKSSKPLYAAAVRLAVVGAGTAGVAGLNAMAATMNIFRHGGQQLNALTQHDYRLVMPVERIGEMLVFPTVHRAGMILCSEEICGLVHLPPPATLEACDGFVHMVAGPEPPAELAEGVPLGVASFAGKDTLIRVAPRQRFRHVHLIGKPDRGKSTLLKHMILHDVRQGESVIVIDPHGDLVVDLMSLLPAEAVTRTILLDPGDPEGYVPSWNPFLPVVGQDPARTATDLVYAVKSVVTDWGDRLERILKCSFHGIQHVPGCCLQDVNEVLTPDSTRGKTLRAEFVKRITNADALSFWLHELKHFNKTELTSPKNKLSKLLLTGTVGQMLSQPESAINLRTIMDGGHILLVNLSSVGMEVRSILGAFLLALIHINALNRASVPPDQRRPTHVYGDEAYLYLPEKLQVFLVEMRKFQVSLTLAQQFLSQCDHVQQRALATVGTTVIFEVNDSDAKTLAMNLYGQVEAGDLMRLETGQAVTRVGSKIARIQTPAPPPIPEVSHREEIIERSRRLYYRKAEDIKATQARDHSPAAANTSPAGDPLRAGSNARKSSGAGAERAYDTF